MSSRLGRLTLEELRVLVDEHQVDTVLVALTDMQGRLQGKRYAARHFLGEVVENAAEACSATSCAASSIAWHNAG